MVPSSEPRRPSRVALWAAGLLFLPAVLLDALVLRWVGVSVVDQLQLVAVVTAWCWAGAAIAPLGLQDLGDRLAFYAVTAMLGMTLHTALCFVAFHTTVIEALGLGDLRGAAGAAFLLLLLLAFFGRRRNGVGARARWVSAPVATAALFSLASLVAILTAFGFLNNQLGQGRGRLSEWQAAGQPALAQPVPPNWGSPQDRRYHLWGGELARRGLPEGYLFGQVRHQGVESLAAGIGFLGGDFSRMRWAALSKPLSLLWLFLGSYWVFLLARQRCPSVVPALLAGAGVLLYSALNPFAFRESVSSYGVCPASGTLYHNITQQASLAVGLAGLYLLYLDLSRARGLFALGCALVGGSFFFKPSLFAVAVPALVIAAALRGRRLPLADGIRGFAVLGACAALWFAYPRLLSLRRALSVPLDVSFLAWHKHQVEKLGWPSSSRLGLALSVLCLSYAAFLLPGSAVVARLARRLRSGRPAARWLRPETALLLATGVAGVLSGLFLAAANGNYLWGGAVGIFCLLPLLTAEIAGMSSRALRRAAWALYGAQLLSGVFNLWLFGYLGIF